MADTIEKIYCTDGRDNDLAAILAATKNNDPATMMAAMGGVDRLSSQVGFSAERVINSVSQGNLQMIQALKDCCCQTQQSIIKMGYENQLGQKDIVNAHSWTTEQLRNVLGQFTPTHNETSGDIAYTANMAYADFYPAVLDTVDKCITYAKLVASDPDGYEGMEFMRWTSDAIGKSLTLNWEDFI